MAVGWSTGHGEVFLSTTWPVELGWVSRYAVAAVGWQKIEKVRHMIRIVSPTLQRHRF
jgi:hypothetical protein